MKEKTVSISLFLFVFSITVVTAFLVVFSLSVATTGFAQTPIPPTAEARLNRVLKLEAQSTPIENPAVLAERALIYATIAGNDNRTKETVEKAEHMLAEACRANPTNYELRAAHGSVITMKAQFETQTAKQMHYVKKGTRMMDRAIKSDPDNIGALQQRGQNSLGLPVFLKRTHVAIHDFSRILHLTEGKKDKQFKAKILNSLCRAYELEQLTENAQACQREAAALTNTL